MAGNPSGRRFPGALFFGSRTAPRDHETIPPSGGEPFTHAFVTAEAIAGWRRTLP